MAYGVRTFVSLSVLMLVGCGGGNSGTTTPIPPTPTPAGSLSAVASDDQLLESIVKGLTETRAVDADNAAGDTLAVTEDASGAAPAPMPDSGFSTTYTQERNVDEFDVVKYDGSFMYVAPMRGYSGCCFALELADAALVAPEPVNARAIRVLETDPANATATALSEIPLEETESVQGLYLAGDRLTAITTETFFGGFGAPWIDIAYWASESVGIKIFDVSDPTAPTLAWDAQIDGGFVQSRRIGDTLYVINRFTPQIDGIDYNVADATARSTNQALLTDVSLDDLLPKMRIDGEEVDLVAPERCFITTEAADVVGYPVLTTITAISISDPDVRETLCYNEAAYGVYVSAQSVYLTQYRWDPESAIDTTRIHKFALSGLSYRGSGDVDGLVWTGGQSDFRMSEHEGRLRVVSTQYTFDEGDWVDHLVHVLAESTTRPALEQIGKLPNDANPEEIGKPNEQLYGVRFFGDRAYLVTFEQIDPLYVLDLSDPTNPLLAGELEVTGFSDFLHPVSNDLLLGLGQGGSGSVKLELFDVSDMANPRSLSTQELGGRGSYSEARYDRHAFTYLSGTDTDRFAIPADLYSLNGDFSATESGLYFFEIMDKADPSLASLNEAGSIVIDPSPGQPWFYGTRHRSVIHDDTVYYIRNDVVWAGFWGQSGDERGPF